MDRKIYESGKRCGMGCAIKFKEDILLNEKIEILAGEKLEIIRKCQKYDDMGTNTDTWGTGFFEGFMAEAEAILAHKKEIK